MQVFTGGADRTAVWYPYPLGRLSVTAEWAEISSILGYARYARADVQRVRLHRRFLRPRVVRFETAGGWRWWQLGFIPTRRSTVMDELEALGWPVDHDPRWR